MVINQSTLYRNNRWTGAAGIAAVHCCSRLKCFDFTDANLLHGVTSFQLGIATKMVPLWNL